ncbi:undecaprenyldiphospho-muramoylpentapeptide beta-N-acetylglucosaminyltransferase [Polynucleobacter sp. IMCC 30228]|uniref:undecaprenyldiphospho-muramoylpentapeptide beta-N-acetylglucosaminyltransferase n=1 Tax=unclassified Polynucleobacter TaxID=2640945 RepID=UPI00351D31B4
MTKPSILVMAGGTGGHIFPGLAVAELLRSRGWQVAWLGHAKGMEQGLVTARGFSFEAVQFGGLRGKGWLTKLLLPFNLLRACAQSWRIIARLKPSVILGMGGYISFPGGLMSFLLQRPLIIHESNAIAGSANRLLGHVANKVLTGFPHTLAKGEWVGNPIRAEFNEIAEPKLRYGQRQGSLNVLVVGGSLGAQALNKVLPAALALIPFAQRPKVIHQSGEKHYSELNLRYEEHGVAAEVLPFIANMANAYAQADVVICRAGAMTVSELAAVGVAACLVPFPAAIDDHQTANAQFLATAAAAILWPQTQFNAPDLARQIQAWTRPELQAMAERSYALAKPNATEQLATICKAVAGVPA